MNLKSPPKKSQNPQKQPNRKQSKNPTKKSKNQKKHCVVSPLRSKLARKTHNVQSLFRFSTTRRTVRIPRLFFSWSSFRHCFVPSLHTIPRFFLMAPALAHLRSDRSFPCLRSTTFSFFLYRTVRIVWFLHCA